MADNTDTELIDWLSKQPCVELNLRRWPYSYGTSEWVVRIDGVMGMGTNLRTVLVGFKSDSDKAKTANKGE